MRLFEPKRKRGVGRRRREPSFASDFYCPYFVEEESDFGGIAFECGFSQVGMQGFTELFFPTNESFGQAVEST